MDNVPLLSGAGNRRDILLMRKIVNVNLIGFIILFF